MATTHIQEKKVFNYGNPDDGMFTLKLVDDFENVLSALIAKKITNLIRI